MSGSEIRLRRERARLTQIEVAAHLGVHDSEVCRWEQGTRKPPARRAAYLEKVLTVYEKYQALAHAELASVA